MFDVSCMVREMIKMVQQIRYVRPHSKIRFSDKAVIESRSGRMLRHTIDYGKKVRFSNVS